MAERQTGRRFIYPDPARNQGSQDKTDEGKRADDADHAWRQIQLCADRRHYTASGNVATRKSTSALTLGVTNLRVG